MAAFAARFQNPRKSGSVLLGFSLLVLFSQLAARVLSQYSWIWSASGDQVVGGLPVASLCHVLVSWTPVGESLAGFCPWVSLFTAAVRVLSRAL
jgi:hypothetical protein